MASKNIAPGPFPGESPTISLAMAAGQKYGLQPDEEKPKAKKASPKRKAKASATAKPSTKAKHR